ncbi:TLD-domain-containing protein [Gongronella butleri]|nr:TLD-domain-containing protein [Gongronella butleri]
MTPSFSSRPPFFLRSMSLTTTSSFVDVTTAECKEFARSPTTIGGGATFLHRRLSNTLSRQGYSWDSSDYCSLTYSSDDEEDDDVTLLLDTPPPALLLQDRHQDTHPLVHPTMAHQLRAWMPKRFSLSMQWKLLYSLDQHGASLSTLYHQLDKHCPLLFAFQDDHGHIFGVFLSEPIQLSTTFYGSGESFLWQADNETGSCHHYPWSMLNSYFVFSNKDMIAFGSGMGTFGICLDADMLNGTTAPCATYGNPRLSTNSHFECIGLEVWTL